MGRTFIRQDTQIRKSDVYTDNLAPSETNYETNPTNIEDDLNSLRSRVHDLLKLRTGHWYDVIATPTTFEGGAQRGIDGLNQDLHDFEHKRVLVENHVLVDVTVPTAVAASGTLTGTANFSDGETVTIGTTVYTFKNPFVDAAFNVDASTDLATSLQNLKDAINLTGTPGSQYGTATTIHPTVAAGTVTGTTLDVAAKVAGTGGNSIATTDTAANASWGGATLSGGAGDVVVLALGELPTETTAAVGSVTTLGTVAAYNAGFPGQSLAEVSGTTAISPKNLSIIVDADTRDPILSGGRVVYALFQTENATDGHTMTGTTPNRAMLTFVRINSTGDGLEYVPAADIAGKDINYTTKTRKYLLGLSEQDFLKGAEIDVPSAATVTRQVAYDNQGVVPVDLTTNATLDLEGPGLVWSIRDDLEATLFSVKEGSAGSNSTIAFGSDVDVFDNKAVLNDFAKGMKVDSTGVEIDIGRTVIANTGTIETTAGNDLRLMGTRELYLDDGNQTGSSWADTNGIKLSDTTAEWTAFETRFGGEVSLLYAIDKAATMGGRKAKVYANVTVTTNANTDVGGSGGGTNLDAQLPDMSVNNFLTDYDVFLNGNLLRPGADASANNDYYPGTSLALGQLKFEFKVKAGDVLCVIPYGPAVT